MALSNVRSTLLLLLLLLITAANSFVHAFAIDGEKKKCFLTPTVSVHVNNMLSGSDPPLLLHCYSRSHDLGIQTVGQNQEFSWTFCTDSVWHGTKYVCTFQVGLKHRELVAYEEARREYCKDNHCYWSARDDGIYFFETKYYDWEN